MLHLKKTLIAGLLSLPVLSSITTQSVAAAISNVSPGQIRVSLDFDPFGVAFNRAGSKLFISSASNGRLEIIDVAGTSPTSQRTVNLAAPALGIAISPDEKYLAVAHNDLGIGLYSLPALLNNQNGLIGIVSTASPSDPSTSNIGSIITRFSADGKLILVSDEWKKRVSVFDVSRILDPLRRSSALIGYVPVGENPVGIELIENGARAQVVSEYSTPTNGNYIDKTTGNRPGTVTLINLATAAYNPAAAVESVVPAGNVPVRLNINKNGYIYVTARGENRVYKIPRATLITQPTTPPAAKINVEESPVGIGYAATPNVLVVANSYRFSSPARPGSISFIDANNDRVLRTIPASYFPRDVAVAANGNTAAVVQANGRAVDVLDVSKIVGR